MMTEDRSTIAKKKQAWQRYLPVLLVICIGIVLTIAAYLVLLDAERQQIRAEFKRAAEGCVAEIQEEVDSRLVVLQAIRGLYRASESVDREEFREFVGPVFNSLDGFRALVWMPRVAKADRVTFEENVRREGIEAFRIWEFDAARDKMPAIQRDFYYPILYAEPLAATRESLGYDPGSDPLRRKELREAQDRGDAAATAAFKVELDPEGPEVFVLFMPVYRNEASAKTLEGRRDNLLGFAAGIYSIPSILGIAAGSSPADEINVRLLDLSAPEGSRVLYVLETTSTESSTFITGPVEAGLLEDLEHSQEIDLGGRTWQVVCTPTLDFISEHRLWYPLGAVPIGLLFTVLIALYLRTLLGREERVQLLVEKRTAELVRAIRELRETQLQLIQAEKMESVGRLAAGVAHEVKNPLAVIQLGLDYLDKALDSSAEDDRMEVVEEMDEAVKRADTVVKGLVDFSRSQKLDMESQALNAVLEESLRMVRHELTKNKIELQENLAGGLPDLMLDRSKMQQVFINLFMNAIQAMERDGVLSVDTHFRAEGDGDPAVVALVEDSGPGIQEDVLHKIFDPFYTTKPVGHGTGLGLSVVKNIIDLHGATLSVRNRDEGGASFEILFPLKGAQA
jgi:signal transduction histidine kinase